MMKKKKNEQPHQLPIYEANRMERPTDAWALRRRIGIVHN